MMVMVNILAEFSLEAIPEMDFIWVKMENRNEKHH